MLVAWMEDELCFLVASASYIPPKSLLLLMLLLMLLLPILLLLNLVLFIGIPGSFTTRMTGPAFIASI